jgi:hypothetical protein
MSAPLERHDQARGFVCVMCLIGKEGLPADQSPRTKYAIARALAIMCMILCAGGQSFAQSSDMACKYYEERCRDRNGPPLCTQLQQRCGWSAVGTTSGRSPIGNAHGMLQLDNPTEFPDCAQGQDMTILPTCQCGSPLDAGDTAGDKSSCTSCTSDGIRIECQEGH